MVPVPVALIASVPVVPVPTSNLLSARVFRLKEASLSLFCATAMLHGWQIDQPHFMRNEACRAFRPACKIVLNTPFLAVFRLRLPFVAR